jgi:hypothetical protein
MRRAVIFVAAVVLMICMASTVTATGSVDPDCPGSLQNQLTIGMRGQIGHYSSTLRSKPGGSGTVILAPAQFTVLELPQCAGYGPLWWLHIRYDDGQEGWASESQVYSIYGDYNYWLEPVSADAPVG